MEKIMSSLFIRCRITLGLKYYDCTSSPGNVNRQAGELNQHCFPTGLPAGGAGAAAAHSGWGARRRRTHVRGRRPPRPGTTSGSKRSGAEEKLKAFSFVCFLAKKHTNSLTEKISFLARTRAALTWVSVCAGWVAERAMLCTATYEGDDCAVCLSVPKMAPMLMSHNVRRHNSKLLNCEILARMIFLHCL